MAKPGDYLYSSYRSYISKDNDDTVYRDLILGMISKDRKNAPARYGRFVDGAIGEELENPLKNVYGGMILERGMGSRLDIGQFGLTSG